jgi:hypothetical protein
MERRRWLVQAMADRFEPHLDTLAPLFTREQGKPLAFARREIDSTLGFTRGLVKLDLPRSRCRGHAGAPRRHWPAPDGRRWTFRSCCPGGRWCPHRAHQLSRHAEVQKFSVEKYANALVQRLAASVKQEVAQ